MNTIVEKITELIKEMLQGWVMSNLEGMFTDVNDKVGTIAGEVSQTPSAWNAGIFMPSKRNYQTINSQIWKEDGHLISRGSPKCVF